MSETLTKYLKPELCLCSVRESVWPQWARGPAGPASDIADSLLSFCFTELLPGALHLSFKQSPKKAVFFFPFTQIIPDDAQCKQYLSWFLTLFSLFKITADLKTLYKVQCVYYAMNNWLFSKNKQIIRKPGGGLRVQKASFNVNKKEMSH